jgi:hypothetical protein
MGSAARMLSRLEDLALALLVVLLVPLVILLIGTPVALIVRGLLELAR